MMNNLMEKLKSNRTRPAEIDGVPVQVRVYPNSEIQQFKNKMDGNDDKVIADFLSAQFLDDAGNQVLTSEFLLSDDCPMPVFIELAELFIQVNSGSYKKKATEHLKG